MPPPGWRPHRDWPPAPAAWRFYVEEIPDRLDALSPRPVVTEGPADPRPDARSSHPPRSWGNRHRVLLAAGATLLVLAGASVYGTHNPSAGTVATMVTTSATAAPVTTATSGP
jgi:hypothetical protein